MIPQGMLAALKDQAGPLNEVNVYETADTAGVGYSINVGRIVNSSNPRDIIDGFFDIIKDSMPYKELENAYQKEVIKTNDRLDELEKYKNFYDMYKEANSGKRN